MSSGYDIHIEGAPIAQVTSTQCLTFGPYPRVLGVQGIQKLVDRFLKCFMTPIGTDLSDPNYGTILAGSFLGNVDPGSLYSIVIQSVAAAQQTLQQYDSLSTSPDNERLSSVQIVDLAIDPTGPSVQMTLQISNVAGTVVQTLMSSHLGAQNG